MSCYSHGRTDQSHLDHHSHSTSIFPLPLSVLPVRPSTLSRRCLSRFYVLYLCVSLFNVCLCALNCLYFSCSSVDCFSSSLYQSSLCQERSSIHSRLCDFIFHSIRSFILTCRRSLPHDQCDRAFKLFLSLFQQHLCQSTSSLSRFICFDSFVSSISSASFACSLPSSLPFDTDPSSFLFHSPSYRLSDTRAIPLIAHRVSLPKFESGYQAVPLLSLLPPPVAALYASSNTGLLLSQPLPLPATIKKPQPHAFASTTEYHALIELMVEKGMVTFIQRPKCVNGLFGVAKPDGSIRLIIDAVYANVWFADPPKVTLPTPTHLSRLMASDQPFYTAKLDLSNYYHCLTIPEWLCEWLALPAVSAECFGLPRSCDPWYPAVRTLPMGFKHSVWLAQVAHEHILYTYTSLSPHDNILNLLSPSLNTTIHTVYIDDLALIGPDAGVISGMVNEVRRCYERVGLICNHEKTIEPTCDAVEVVGVELNGSDGTLQVSTSKRFTLLTTALTTIMQGHVTGYELAHLIGHFTWSMLLNRPALSMLRHSYRFIELAKHKRFDLWPSVIRELLCCCALLPLLTVNLRAPFHSRVPTTDASSTGAGVMFTGLDQSLFDALFPMATASNGQLFDCLFSPPTASPPPVSGPFTVQPCFAVSSLDRLSVLSSAVARLHDMVDDYHWSLVTAYRFKHSAHINQLELQALCTCVKWLLSFPSTINSRVLTLTDSAVVLYVIRKGRTSSATLIRVVHRIAAMLLASGMSLLPVWLPSALNPADAPSRSFQLLRDDDDYDIEISSFDC